LLLKRGAEQEEDEDVISCFEAREYNLEKRGWVEERVEEEGHSFQESGVDAENVADVALKKAVLTSKKTSKIKIKAFNQAGVAVSDVDKANFCEPMKMDPTVVANQLKAMEHLEERTQLMIDGSDIWGAGRSVWICL
jgi:hypothetical protein